MKKSNWIIIAVLVIASILFLILWFSLGFNLVHQLDLVLTIIWWFIVIVICVAIHIVESRRQRAIRKSYLAPGIIYNSEAGMVRVDPSQNIVDVLQGVLESLDYNVSNVPASPNERIEYNYIVSSDKFSDNGLTWEGEVVQVSTDSSFGFIDKGELKRILGVA